MELHLKDIPDALFLRLSARAQKAGRSINDEVIQILRMELERPAIGFADDAQRVLALASEEAKGLNDNYIGTEHILLGLAAGEIMLVSPLTLDFTVNKTMNCSVQPRVCVSTETNL